jgi:hypothetical protein
MRLLDEKYVKIADTYKIKKKSSVWKKYAVLAAGFCIVILGAYLIRNEIYTNENELQLPNTTTHEENYVNILSIIKNNTSFDETSEEVSTIQIADYSAIYEKITLLNTEVLSECISDRVCAEDSWYYISGHEDIQYLIKKDEKTCSLWKFRCFESKQYSYSDVLSTVYQIESSDDISKIIVNPATMDNTDAGKTVQKEIGQLVITDENSIDRAYRIISSLTCYGQNNWERINYGAVDAASDDNSKVSVATRMGRYITIVTKNGNEIDGLKYTAVSNMFYEYSGIAYEPLTSEKAEELNKLMNIEINN